MSSETAWYRFDDKECKTNPTLLTDTEFQTLSLEDLTKHSFGNAKKDLDCYCVIYDKVSGDQYMTTKYAMVCPLSMIDNKSLAEFSPKEQELVQFVKDMNVNRPNAGQQIGVKEELRFEVDTLGSTMNTTTIKQIVNVEESGTSIKFPYKTQLDAIEYVEDIRTLDKNTNPQILRGSSVENCGSKKSNCTVKNYFGNNPDYKDKKDKQIEWYGTGPDYIHENEQVIHRMYNGLIKIPQKPSFMPFADY